MTSALLARLSQATLDINVVTCCIAKLPLYFNKLEWGGGWAEEVREVRQFLEKNF